MQNSTLQPLNFAQKRRLAFIDFLLLFKGSFSRADLTNKFEMANATRDIALYRELEADNCVFDNPSKLYRQSKLFTPLFEHDARKTLVKLANKISDGFDVIGKKHFPAEAPSQLNVPDISIIARLVQAILNNKSVSVIYTSLCSGSVSRELVPIAIDMDYGISDGVLNLNVKAALAGYLLRCWNVNCTEYAILEGAEYQQYLQNHKSLFGADNLSIAPRYNQQ